MAASGYAGHLTPCNRGFPTLRIDECNMTRRESPKRYVTDGAKTAPSMARKYITRVRFVEFEVK